jgi:hypothetical protein
MVTNLCEEHAGTRSESEGRMCLPHIGTHIPVYMESHPRGLQT